MRPANLLLSLLFVAVCVTRVAGQYADSLEVSDGSERDNDEEADEGSGSQEVAEDGSEDGTAEDSEDREEDSRTTAIYDDPEKEDDDLAEQPTTMGRLPGSQSTFPMNRIPPNPEAGAGARPQGGSPYISYRGGYNPYFYGNYLNQYPARPPSFEKPPFSPTFGRMPADRMGQPNSLDIPGNGGDAPLPEDHLTREENLDYLRKLRRMIILARLRNHYGEDTHLPFGPAHSVSTLGHNLSQAMFQEMATLKDRLRFLELERIKLHTILLQIKEILSDMHERSSRYALGIGSRLNMSVQEIRVARLRNLFTILRAITKLTPLSPDDLAQINYDAGLFDPRISEGSKAAMINRIAVIFRKKDHESGDFPHEAATSKAPDHLPKFGFRNHFTSENQRSPGPMPFPRPAPPPATQPDQAHERREVLQCKLRRLRNLYLLIRPFVTGVRLTQEELQEISQSREGFFEPSLTEQQKIALVSKMADTIRMAHVSRQLILNSTSSETSKPSSTQAADSLLQTGETSTTSPRINRIPVLIITQRVNNDMSKTPASYPDRMHISGKIQMDLNVDGDVDPAQEGLLSKLL